MSDPDIGIQHQVPPIYYCWKYWLSTGELAEGCTSVNPLSTDDILPDVNLYGWMYIVVPIAALTLIIGILYKCCKGTHVPQPELLDDSSILEDEFGETNDLYTVVSVDGKPAKVPVQPRRFQNTVTRLYPRLSAVNSFKRPVNPYHPPSMRRNYQWPNIVRAAQLSQKMNGDAMVAAKKEEKEDLVVNQEEQK